MMIPRDNFWDYSKQFLVPDTFKLAFIIAISTKAFLFREQTRYIYVSKQ